MHELLEFLNQNAIIKAFGLSLLHSLWQGMAIALLLWFVVRVSGKQSASLRYGIALSALLSLLLCFGFTLYHQLNVLPEYQESVAQAEKMSLIITNTGEGASSPGNLWRQIEQQWSQLPGWIYQHIAYFFMAWSLGFFIFSFRFFTGLFYLRSLKQEGEPLPAMWVHKVEGLKKKLGLHKEVHLIATEKADSPLTFGWLRPVIILPLSIVAALPEEQVESILLHELAHIRRNDYLVNLLQSFMEITFFFNPGYWYISRVLEIEREHVCDDMVVAHSSSARTYALALTRLAELSAFKNTRLAMAIAQKESSLIFRIKRIVQPSNQGIMKSYRKGRSYQLTSVIIACAMLVLFAVEVNGNNEKIENTSRIPHPTADSAITVSGIVMDKNGGTELPGVAISIKNSNTGTASDMGGNFTMEAKPYDTLIFSFVGFHTKEVAVSNESYHAVILESKVKATNSSVIIHDIQVTQSKNGKEDPETELKGKLTSAKAPAGRIVVLPLDEGIKKFMPYISDEEVKLEDIKHGGREISPGELEAIDQSRIESNLTISSEETGHRKAITLVKLKSKAQSDEDSNKQVKKPQPLIIVLKDILNIAEAETEDYKAAIVNGRRINDVKEIEPESIASVNIVKDEELATTIGEGAAGGIIFITLKEQEVEKEERLMSGPVESLLVFPNPAEGNVKVKFTLDKKQQVKLSVRNADGEEVHSFVKGRLEKGPHEFEWNTAAQRAGIYSLILTTEGESRTTKLVLK